MGRCIRHRSVGKKTGPNPTDRAKSGTKESVWVEGRGVPLGIVVAGANVNDFKLTEATLDSSPISRPDPRVPDVPEAGAVQSLSLDADYLRVEIYELLERWGFTAHIRPVGSGSGAARRGGSADPGRSTGSRRPGASVGGRTDAQLAASVSRAPDPLDEETPELSWPPALCLWPDCFPSQRPIGIGS